jgi:hypothetical protein
LPATLLEMMSRWSLTLCLLFALGCALGFGYSHVTRPRWVAGGWTHPQSVPPVSAAALRGSLAGSSDPPDSVPAQPGQVPREHATASTPEVMLVLANGSAGDPAGWLAAVEALAVERPLQAISVLRQRLDSIGESDDPHFIARVRQRLAELQQRFPERD